MQSGKPKILAEKIVQGRMKKFINQISLINQPFVMDLDKSISQLLKEYNTEVTGFTRFEVGEGIGKEN